MEDIISSKKRGRVDSDEFEFGSLEVKRLKDDLLGLLDDSELSTTTQDLDSFMKSFEDEIKYPSVPPVSQSGDSQPELGFLFGASDDELGLPPSSTTDKNGSVESELLRISSGSPELSELFGFGDQLSYFDSLEGGIDQGSGYRDNGEYVALDGLFDYSELGIELSEFSWRPETMPAQ